MDARVMQSAVETVGMLLEFDHFVSMILGELT